jgi:hypothetical protein
MRELLTPPPLPPPPLPPPPLPPPPPPLLPPPPPLMCGAACLLLQFFTPIEFSFVFEGFSDFFHYRRSEGLGLMGIRA